MGIFAKQNYMIKYLSSINLVLICSWKVLISGSPLTDPKLGPDYSVYQEIIFFSILHMPLDHFAYTRLKTTDTK
jgi:hypothetical protein